MKRGFKSALTIFSEIGLYTDFVDMLMSTDFDFIVKLWTCLKKKMVTI